MLFWWCALGVVLSIVYMIAYTLLRTSGDGRPWHTRLLRPRGAGGRTGGTRSSG
jgi:hypothetical protein